MAVGLAYAGVSISRNTYFVCEDGWRRHLLTEEERLILMPSVPCEDFVAAQR